MVSSYHTITFITAGTTKSPGALLHWLTKWVVNKYEKFANIRLIVVDNMTTWRDVVPCTLPAIDFFRWAPISCWTPNTKHMFCLIIVRYFFSVLFLGLSHQMLFIRLHHSQHVNYSHPLLFIVIKPCWYFPLWLLWAEYAREDVGGIRAFSPTQRYASELVKISNMYKNVRINNELAQCSNACE